MRRNNLRKRLNLKFWNNKGKKAFKVPIPRVLMHKTIIFLIKINENFFPL